ncbi:MAG TPA: BatA domain-containing protein [Gemmatimonadaceae bacterium]|nr:BatA domain-containing protein [Gemmatimonadaceae bacterium]
MSFLSPVYLLLAAAAAVPLLIHLMRRRIGTRVELPSVRYLARAEQEHSRKLRLRNLLLMLLRVLAVLAIAAAAARPVGRIAGAGHAPTALAIVLDNSLSSSAILGGAPVLDRLKSAAASAARAASPSDRLWLVTADGTVSGGSPSAVASAAERAEPLAGAGDPPAALLRAASLVRGAGLAEREVALLTDAQSTTWSRAVQLGDVRVVVLPAGLAAPANHAVVGVDVRPPRWTPRGAVVGRLLVAGDSAAYRVAVAAAGLPRTLARGTAAAAPGATTAEFTVQAAPPERGWVAGSVELEPDELRGDDARYFALWIGPAPALAVDPSAGPFVRTATDALLESSRARAASGASSPADAAVAVVAGDALTRLPALILAPADPVRIGAANRALERAGVPWRFGAQRRGDAAVRASAGTTPLEGVTASLRYALVATPGGAGMAADTLATTAGSEPWIVAGRGYAIVASPLVPEATSLPVRAAFVPLLAELATQRLGGAAGPLLSAAPGASVVVPAGVDALQGAASGAPRLPLAPGPTTAPSRPGVYFLLRGAERAGALVVNAEAEESVLGRLSSSEMGSRIGARDVRVVAAGDRSAWPAAVFASSTRRPLVTPLLLAALALLIAETALTRAGGGLRRAGGGAASRAAARSDAA